MIKPFFIVIIIIIIVIISFINSICFQKLLYFTQTLTHTLDLKANSFRSYIDRKIRKYFFLIFKCRKLTKKCSNANLQAPKILWKMKVKTRNWNYKRFSTTFVFAFWFLILKNKMESFFSRNGSIEEWNVL